MGFKRNGWMIMLIVVVMVVVAAGSTFAGGAKEGEGEKLTYGYISPGPDTWYKRVGDGFQFGCEKYGVDLIMLNSDYDVQKELANIDSMITQGVDGLNMFSFNENGARIAAEECKKAGIPVVVTDSAGAILEQAEVVAAIDFDWTLAGEMTMKWLAENRPGTKWVNITGNFSSLPMIYLNKSMEEWSAKLGLTLVDTREGKYDPNLAVDIAQDLVQSGMDFETMYVSDEDMGAAVIRMLKDRNLINNPYWVLSENGSPAGVPLLKDGSLKYTVSMSPTYEGVLGFLALHKHVLGASTEVNQQVLIPIFGITKDNMEDIVPWEPEDPEIFFTLTEKTFPELLDF
ncbi:MAG: sugar ABC transporter substrate-binding protein [Spirochaetales bacterium]|nr:sugar ABC transporter substrate-binding protein [Spirochaetales bacterium]